MATPSRTTTYAFQKNVFLFWDEFANHPTIYKNIKSNMFVVFGSDTTGKIVSLVANFFAGKKYTTSPPSKKESRIKYSLLKKNEKKNLREQIEQLRLGLEDEQMSGLVDAILLALADCLHREKRVTFQKQKK